MSQLISLFFLIAIEWFSFIHLELNFDRDSSLLFGMGVCNVRRKISLLKKESKFASLVPSLLYGRINHLNCEGASIRKARQFAKPRFFDFSRCFTNRYSSPTDVSLNDWLIFVQNLLTLQANKFLLGGLTLALAGSLMRRALIPRICVTGNIAFRGIVFWCRDYEQSYLIAFSN